jgi:hypothetical protein
MVSLTLHKRSNVVARMLKFCQVVKQKSGMGLIETVYDGRSKRPLIHRRKVEIGSFANSSRPAGRNGLEPPRA